MLNLAFAGFRHGHILALYDTAKDSPLVNLCGAFEEDSETELKYSIPDILEALAALPDHYRSVISLHLLEGYDYQEISEMTGTEESTIRSLYMRGRQKLAATLKKRQS